MQLGLITMRGGGMRLVLLLVIVSAIGKAEQIPSFLINCGSNSNVTVDGRTWTGDGLPADATDVTLTSVGFPANTSDYTGDSELARVYGTARVFTASSNYTVKLAKGNYFLRLHFYPFVFGSYDLNHSVFGVVANGVKLVSEFNVSDSILCKSFRSRNLSADVSLVKEYYLGVDKDVLVIDFVPSKGSFGFVNAIEIVLVANSLFKDNVPKVDGKGANNFLDMSGRGMETMYRLDVGGSAIVPSRDSDLRRFWELDVSYMVTANAGIAITNETAVTYASDNETSAAPLLLYQTARTMSNSEVVENKFNMSWKFEVDPDFDYLIRMHFCELENTMANQRIFRIYINNRTAADNFDIYERAGGANIAYHQDYLDGIPSKINALWVQLGPETITGASETNAILNGLEIFKVSRNGNLAYVRKFLQSKNSNMSSSKKVKLLVGIGAGIALMAVLGAVISVLFYRREKANGTKKRSPRWKPFFHHGSSMNITAHARELTCSQNNTGSGTTNRTGKRFTLAVIRAATNNFDESLVIGVGGFGKVYKGEIEGTFAAIKRAHPQSQQGLAEFETEIEMLSKLRHRHLVCMIGFCEEQNEMILVYEYMANGTLRSHLFGSDLPPLTWKQRIEACIGAARGLHYLHTGADRGVIHRDVKTTNILLDDNFVAKMADFGLSKTGPSLDHTHVSTAVKGSFGYLDPEYFRKQQLTEKSDVYSFGVVLFEVVCARAVINPSLPRDQINLAEWALRWQRERSLESIIAPNLKDSYSPESMLKFGEVAEKCLSDEGKSRPTMGEVLWHLEYVLQLQDAWLRSNNTSDNSFSGIKEDKPSAEADTSTRTETEPNKSDESSFIGAQVLTSSSF